MTPPALRNEENDDNGDDDRHLRKMMAKCAFEIAPPGQGSRREQTEPGSADRFECPTRSQQLLCTVAFVPPVSYNYQKTIGLQFNIHSEF